MKLNTITSGMTSVNVLSALNLNFNGFDNCATGSATLTEIENALIGQDLVDAINGNNIELNSEYSASITNISIGERGSALINILNTNFSNFQNIVLNENDALFDRMVEATEEQETTLTDAIKEVIDEAIFDLKFVGIWSESDAIYFFNLHNRRSSLLNWIQEKHDCWFNEIDWNPKVGFLGLGVANKIDPFYNPSADAVKYAQDSAVIGYFSTTNDLTDGMIMVVAGNYSANPMSEINIRTANFQCKLNSAGNGASGSYVHSNDIDGLIVLERAASDDLDLYKDGVKYDLATTASSGLPPFNLFFTSNTSSSYSKNDISFGILGAKIGTLNSDLFDIVSNFNTKIKLAIPDGSKRGLYKTTKPMMVIRFDDGLADCYSKWKGVLDSYNVKGLSVLLTSLMGMTWEQITEMQNDGWEFGGHGTDGTDLSTVTRAEALAILIEVKTVMEAHGITCNHFTPQAYGQGSLSVRADAMKYYKSIHAGSAVEEDFTGINPQILDHTNLNAMRLDIGGSFDISTVDGMALVKTHLDTTISDNRLAIVFMHGWTSDKEADLREVIEYAINGGIEIITLSQAFANCEVI